MQILDQRFGQLLTFLTKKFFGASKILHVENV